MLEGKKILVTGHHGLVGSAVLRRLDAVAGARVLTVEKSAVNLCDQRAVDVFFKSERPEIVVLAAARVGGIQANIASPGSFLHENLLMQANTIHAAHEVGVERLVFLGSSCIYPAACPQPMREEHLLTGPLEPTNEGYALAKIAGIKMVRYYHKQYGLAGISLQPSNIYGTNDSFDLERSHVLSALVRRFVDAGDEGRQTLTLWGTGIARREFMHVDDLAEAIIFAIETLPADGSYINVGTGSDVTIRELAEMIASMTGFKGEIAWDASKPDGMLRKCLDVSKITALGFRSRISLEEGVRRTIAEYKRIKSEGAVR